MKKLFITVTTILFLLSASNQASAQTPRPSFSPTPSPAASASTTQLLRERIERVVEEQREQIAGVLDELAGEKRGYVGEIQRITSETMTVKTAKGTKIISLQPDIVITKANQPVAIGQVAVGEWAIVIGTLRDDDLVPERIVISSASLRPRPQVITIGSIEAITASTISITSRQNSNLIAYSLPKNVVFQDISGATIKPSQISPQMQAIIIGQRPDDTTLNALIVRVLVENPRPTTPTPSPRTTTRPTIRPTASPRANPL